MEHVNCCDCCMVRVCLSESIGDGKGSDLGRGHGESALGEQILLRSGVALGRVSKSCLD